MTVGFAQDALEFRPYRRRDGEDRTECDGKSPQILSRGGGGEGELKPSIVCRLRPSSSSSGQRCSVGEKQYVQRTFWSRSAFKKDARTTIGGEPEGCSNGILIGEGLQKARYDERMVSEVARGES
jgi:hypothetical protein